MAIMNYETQGIAKIEFKDNLFVTTELDKDTNQQVKEYIESRGGFIKDSVTKSTNYLIYKDGKEETAKYKKALELVQEEGIEIVILSLSLFNILCKNKEIIAFGSYPFEVDGAKKPIKWFVLKKNAKKAMLLSAYALDAKQYNEKFEGVTWETCTLRKWLNGDFYHAAFSDEEKKQILLTKIENADNPLCQTPGGNDTEDKIFLLSIDEVKEYLTEALERRTIPTPYALAQGAGISYGRGKGNCRWWLRSPGDYAGTAAGVYYDGNIDGFCDYVISARIAVCPALWANLESDI